METMKLIITIDTEEDNWSRYSVSDNPVSNIKQIIPLQKMFDEYDIKPVYLVSYPVATNKSSVKILKNILDEGRCEIGSHCHPWNTPPYHHNSDIKKHETMLYNLPSHIVHKKLSVLHETIYKNFRTIPISFRAGRWAFGPSVALSLNLLGYRIDSSLTPFIDWRQYGGPDFRAYSTNIFSFDSGGKQLCWLCSSKQKIEAHTEESSQEPGEERRAWKRYPVKTSH